MRYGMTKRKSNFFGGTPRNRQEANEVKSEPRLQKIQRLSIAAIENCHTVLGEQLLL